MKTYSLLILLLISLLISCNTTDNPCELGEGVRLTNKIGEARFDDRFGRIVIRLIVEGSIDSFEVYIPCNLPEGIQSGMSVVFDGIAVAIPDNEKPDNVIAGEEFFSIKLISVSDNSISN